MNTDDTYSEIWSPHYNTLTPICKYQCISFTEFAGLHAHISLITSSLSSNHISFLNAYYKIYTNYIMLLYYCGTCCK